MQTPIDFGKSFLNSFFDARNIDECQEFLAYDLVWITPKQMHHFLTAKEVRDFLETQLGEKDNSKQGSQTDPENPTEADLRAQQKTQRERKRFVDIVSIKSSPSASNVLAVAYEINLVPREGEKVSYLCCSMVICKRGKHFEITFIHMSERFKRGGMEQIREFTENLPCGVLIFAYVKAEKGLQTLFYNEYFWHKLRYKEDTFHQQMERDPFFMIAEEERDQLMSKLEEISGTEKHLALNVTFYRRDGNRFQYCMIGAPAYKEGENTVYYCVFQETTGFNMLHAQMKEKVTAAEEVIDKLPGGICVLAGEAGDWHTVYVNKALQERLGLSASAITEEIGKDPFYALEMTSITHDKLVKKHLHLLSEDVYVGMFPMATADGSKRWTDVYLVNSADHKGNRLRMLYYLDKEEARQRTEHQIAKAENASKLQQERARAEIQKAQENAKKQIDEANTSVREQIEAAQAQTQEQIESFRVRMNKVLEVQKGSVEARQKELQKSYEEKEQALQKSYENKEQMLEKQLDNYKLLQEQEAAKRQKTADDKAMEYERSMQDKQREIDKLELQLEQALRDLQASEDERARERDASALREQEQNKLVERLQNMAERQAQGEIRTGNALHELGVAGREQESYSGNSASESVGSGSAGNRRNPAGDTGNTHASVVDDLVKMAASDDDVLQEERFSLDECLQNVMLLQEPACREKNVDLELKKSVSMPPEAIGDKAKLQRALVSLLESVTQQTPPGSRIHLGCRADKASGNRVYLYFTVRDSESGLASELMTGMFEKKSEKDDPLRAGLYTAREIISSMGGNVRVRSRRGAGTEFMITVCMNLP